MDPFLIGQINKINKYKYLIVLNSTKGKIWLYIRITRGRIIHFSYIRIYSVQKEHELACNITGFM